MSTTQATAKPRARPTPRAANPKQQPLADNVPLAMQQGDEVYLILPVTVRQRCRDGSIQVIGSGLTRFAEPHELLRATDVARLRGQG